MGFCGRLYRFVGVSIVIVVVSVGAGKVLDRYWVGIGCWAGRGFGDGVRVVGLGVVLGGLVKDRLCRVGDGRWAMGGSY